MKTKRCARCGHRKSIEEFTKNRAQKDGRNHSCRGCHSKYQKRHYRENKRYYKSKARAYSRSLAQVIRDAKDKPCMDCGKKYPHYVMDFDHRDRKSKTMNLSSMATKTGLRKVKQEISKCDVVCSNCHRERTHGPGVRFPPGVQRS